MEFEMICLLAAGLSGGFINGLAGFGTGLFALGWLLQVMPPQHAVAIVVLVSVLISMPGVWKVRKHIRARRQARFLVPALIGMPLGFGLLQSLDMRMLSLLVAALMLVYGGYFSLRRTLPLISGNWYSVDVGAGFLGGVLGAMAGLSGAVPSMWIALRPWPKTEQRGALQPFNVVILGIMSILMWRDGIFDRAVLQAMLIILPASLAGSLFGLWCFGKMPEGLYSRILIGLMLVSGVVLMARTLAVQFP